MKGFELQGGLHAIERRHADVEYDNIGAERHGRLDRRPSVGDGGDYIERLAEYSLRRLQDGGIVIREQNARFVVRLRLLPGPEVVENLGRSG